MSEPNASRTPDVPAPGQPRPRRSSAQRKRQQSVLTYIVILFIAAFLLLLVSLFMERRQSNEMIGGLTESMSGLRESVSAMQSVQALYEENDQLKTQIQSLKDQLENQKAELHKAAEEAAGLRVELDKTIRALDLFWQIDEAYVRGRYSLCRQLITGLQEQELAEYLPKESTTDNDRFSPADRYQEIYAALY
jgi:regulator of replication initiation timing